MALAGYGQYGFTTSIEGFLAIHKRLSDKLNKTSTVKEASEICLGAAIELSGMDCGGVYLFNRTENSFELTASLGLSKYFLASMSKLAADSEYGKFIFFNGPHYTHFSDTNLPMNEALRMENIKACAIVPIVDNGKTPGCFNLASHSMEDFPSSCRPVIDMIVTDLLGTLNRLGIEEELIKQKNSVQQYLSLANVIFVALDREGIVTMINKKGCELLGIPEEYILGRHWFANFVTKEERDRVEHVFRNLMEGLIEPFEYFENEMITVNRQRRLIAWHNSYIRDGSNNITGTLSSGEDITEKRRAAVQLRENQDALERAWRLNTLAEMATGFAHELNQPLAAIENYSKACEMMIKSGDMNQQRLFSTILKISEQNGRAADIIERIRNLALNKRPEKNLQNINDLLTETVNLIRDDADHKNIKIDMNMSDNLPQIYVDKVQIEQVILNLLKNAFEALTENPADRRKVEVFSRLVGNSVIEVSVSDNGKGLSDDIAGKIFDSFFTTKPEGLGIGLSLSKRIIEAHNGRIWTELNETAKEAKGVKVEKSGAVFRFTLPLKG